MLFVILSFFAGPAELVGSQSSLHPSTVSVPSEHSAFGSTVIPVSIHSDHSAFIPIDVTSHSIHSESAGLTGQSASQMFGFPDDPLQLSRRKQSSPKPGSVSGSQSIVSGNVSRQESNFDQTILDQVSILRDTLKSPSSCSSNMEEALTMAGSEHIKGQQNLHVFEQANISTSENSKSTFLKPNVPVTASSNPFLHPEPGPSRSEAIQLLHEAIQSNDSKSCENVKELSEQGADLGNVKFDEDNQLTVIPATNPFDPKKTQQSGPRLEDLFRPIAEEENIQKNLSYELVNTESGEQVQQTQSQTGELDVFTHLFQDDDTQ